MTLEEVLNGLEGLKDLTNDSGKRTIDVLKSAVRTLVEKPETLVAQSVKVEAIEDPADSWEATPPEPKTFEPLNAPKKRRAYKRKPAK